MTVHSSKLATFYGLTEIGQHERVATTGFIVLLFETETNWPRHYKQAANLNRFIVMFKSNHKGIV